MTSLRPFNPSPASVSLAPYQAPHLRDIVSTGGYAALFDRYMPTCAGLGAKGLWVWYPMSVDWPARFDDSSPIMGSWGQFVSACRDNLPPSITELTLYVQRPDNLHVGSSAQEAMGRFMLVLAELRSTTGLRVGVAWDGRHALRSRSAWAADFVQCVKRSGVRTLCEPWWDRVDQEPWDEDCVILSDEWARNTGGWPSGPNFPANYRPPQDIPGRRVHMAWHEIWGKAGGMVGDGQSQFDTWARMCWGMSRPMIVPADVVVDHSINLRNLGGPRITRAGTASTDGSGTPTVDGPSTT